MSLYRKHRPQKFSEILGQGHVSETLLKQLQSGKISHAYLFSGPRGTGKTSTARIFAKALNCKNYQEDKYGEPCNKCENCTSITEGRYLDVIEIDAASNRGIDEIRDLREKINLAPLVGKFKVYIIDEAHQLTGEAFNALLKTLEEPPAHAIFILATTESQKIPATILSRVQKYDFGKAAKGNIEEKLKRVVKKEGAKIGEDSLALIANLSEGSFRDSEVLLDKIISVNPQATAEEVEKILGKGSGESLIDLLDLVLMKKTKEAILWFGMYLDKGGNPKVLIENIVELLREVLLIQVGVASEKETKYTQESFTKLTSLSSQLSQEKLSRWISLFTTALSEMRDSPITALPIELALVEACEFQVDVSDGTNTDETVKEEIEKSETETKKVEETTQEESKGKTLEVGEVENKIKKNRSGDITIEEIQKNWSEVLKMVKPHNNSLEIFLRSAVPVEIDDDLIILEVGYKFHKERLEDSKNSAVIETVLSEVLGRPVRIKGKVSDNPVRKVRATEGPIEEVDPVEIFGKLV